MEKEILSLIKTPLARRILDELASFLKKNLKFDLTLFSKLLPSELTDGFAGVILGQEEIHTEKPELLEREVKGVIVRLKLLENQDRREELTRQMKELEGKGEKGKLMAIKAKYNRLNVKRTSLERDKDSGIILHEA